MLPRTPMLLLLALLALLPLWGCGSDSSSTPAVNPVVLGDDTFAGTYQSIIAIQTSDRILSLPLRLSSNGSGLVRGSAAVDLEDMTPTPSSDRTFDLIYENDGGGQMTLFGEVDGVLRHPFAKGAVSTNGRIMAWCHTLTTDIVPPGLWIGLSEEANTREASLVGDYHFVSVSVDTTAPVDQGRVGTWTFDGQGGLLISDVVTNDAGVVGAPASSPFLYSYGVPDEGLVTLTGENRIWLGSILGAGELGVFTDLSTGPASGFLLSVALCLPVAPGANDGTVSGRYHFAGLSYDALDFTSNFGTIESDGAGNLTGTVLENEDGFTTPPQNVTATYVVGPNGAFTLTTPGGDVFEGGVSASGDIVIFGGGTTNGTERGVFLLFR